MAQGASLGASAGDLRAVLESGALAAARGLLGCHLVRVEGRGRRVGRIVETEAYTQDDPASHTFRGRTPRNATMFGRAGLAYVYFTYGMHFCLNVVTGPEGSGEAVLLRAVEVVEGEAAFRAARGWGAKPLRGMLDGPAKLVQGFGLGREWDGHDLLAGRRLYLVAGELAAGESIAVTPRIGIRQAADWPRRFVVVRA